MLRLAVIWGVVAFGVSALGGAADLDAGSEGANGAPGNRWVRAGQEEIVRIEREVADLNAILEAQKALIEYRRAGGDRQARLDGRLCLESVLGPLCETLGLTFALGGKR